MCYSNVPSILREYVQNYKIKWWRGVGPTLIKFWYKMLRNSKPGSLGKLANSVTITSALRGGVALSLECTNSVRYLSGGVRSYDKTMRNSSKMRTLHIPSTYIIFYLFIIYTHNCYLNSSYLIINRYQSANSLKRFIFTSRLSKNILCVCARAPRV